MQSILQTLETFSDNYLFWVQIPQINKTDIVEIIIITILFYNIMVWIKNTRAWMLFKGILVLLVFTLIAAIFQMNTILWIAEKTVNVGIIAVIIVFQPELRRALEQLGRKNFLSSIFSYDPQKNNGERYSEKTINELVKACFEMGKVKTGALIVMRKEDLLTEYERTGITLDADLSSQLLINIFEHNTPLHDGAIIVCGDKITSATCYLPLSDNLELSKELGTRHRAAVGISEATDSLTIVVSEETGYVSVAEEGKLKRNITPDQLRDELQKNQRRFEESGRIQKWKRRLMDNDSDNNQEDNQ